jgi:hypothetical protein
LTIKRLVYNLNKRTAVERNWHVIHAARILRCMPSGWSTFGETPGGEGRARIISSVFETEDIAVGRESSRYRIISTEADQNE